MDLETILATPTLDTIAPEKVAEITSQPPFRVVQGVFNLRDLPLPVRPGYVFRAGALDNITTDGQRSLTDLGVRTIFDLRSERETKDSPDPVIDGVDVVWVPSTAESVTAEEKKLLRREKFDVSLRCSDCGFYS
jgi:hypothetical protein